ncbi:hypothetical protein [Leptolyngbya ohadii]|uniref:hypothetical protein n=1 Tax=Leptolyngbya ohadii TaxID=1962290 RepID=UPI000B5A1A4B|nr:hypothetical protein [Leptolyngbya ohadii]
MNFPVFRSVQKNALHGSANQSAKRSILQSANSNGYSLQRLILLTAAIVNGLILVAPNHRTSTVAQTHTQTVLPPVSKSNQEYYASEVERYNKRLQSFHTQQEHVALADSLANAGCREAATAAYKAVMFHDSKSHIHSPISYCNP